MTKKHGKGGKAPGPGPWHFQAPPTQDVFFGNIPRDMPEAMFLQIVMDKVGDIAKLQANKPSERSWGLIMGPTLCSKALV